MKKDLENIAKKTAELTEEMSQLTVDKINEIAPEPTLDELKLTAKQKASDEGVIFVEPKRKFKGLGKLPEKLKREHARAWEYVKGIYENYVVNNEPVRFWHNGDFPGDPDCLWEIPSNKPVYVPRFIAKHLEECQKYHQFTSIAATSEPAPMNDYQVASLEWFRPSSTHYRGKFRAIGVFA